MPPSLVACPACTELVVEGSCVCPHCAFKHPCHARRLSRAAALLGLGMISAGCDGPAVQSDYSAAWTETAVETDEDNDGWSEEDGDCDDDNADIHPEAEETPGDGVDSNCDDEDDT